MLIAGVDEAGRGALCGSVFAAAVILNPKISIIGLKDSKKLSAKKRALLFDEICQHALSYCIASSSVSEIEELNILKASMLAMQRAVQGLAVMPHKVVVDGNRLPKLELPCEAIIGGDDKVTAISAASILAKVARDKDMLELNALYPGYGISQHKGYGTRLHLMALHKLGASPIHRQSFAPVRNSGLVKELKF